MRKSKYSVFIVDDEKLIRMGLRQLIDWNACGFTVCGEAANGRDAIPEIMSKEIDLVLTDIKMPGISGLELAKIIARERPGCYVIIMTGFGELSYAKEAIKANVFDFLQKPVDPEELEASVRRLYGILQSRSIPYPFDEENKLISAIVSSNGDMAISALDAVVKKILNLNPVTFLVNGYRNCFINKVWFWEQPKRLIYFLIITAILLILAIATYKKLRKDIPDVL